MKLRDYFQSLKTITVFFYLSMSYFAFPLATIKRNGETERFDRYVNASSSLRGMSVNKLSTSKIVENWINTGRLLIILKRCVSVRGIVIIGNMLFQEIA